MHRMRNDLLNSLPSRSHSHIHTHKIYEIADLFSKSFVMRAKILNLANYRVFYQFLTNPTVDNNAACETYTQKQKSSKQYVCSVSSRFILWRSCPATQCCCSPARYWSCCSGPIPCNSQWPAVTCHTHHPARVHAQQLPICDTSGGDHLLYPRHHLNDDIPAPSWYKCCWWDYCISNLLNKVSLHILSLSLYVYPRSRVGITNQSTSLVMQPLFLTVVCVTYTLCCFLHQMTSLL